MEVEISKEQRQALGEKVGLCVAFLKEVIQPHLIKRDKIVIPMGEVLDLCITSKELYVTRTWVVNLFIDFYFRKVLYLEKIDRKKAKKYICEAYPELAVDFLKHWDKAKQELLEQLTVRNKQIEDLDNFVSSFRL